MASIPTHARIVFGLTRFPSSNLPAHVIARCGVMASSAPRREGDLHSPVAIPRIGESLCYPLGRRMRSRAPTAPRLEGEILCQSLLRVSRIAVGVSIGVAILQASLLTRRLGQWWSQFCVHVGECLVKSSRVNGSCYASLTRNYPDLRPRLFVFPPPSPALQPEAHNGVPLQLVHAVLAVSLKIEVFGTRKAFSPRVG